MIQKIRIVADAGELARHAADEILHRARAAVEEKDVFNLTLSGGSTPRSVYALLADGEAPYLAQFPWSKTHFFWGDERHVPPDHPDSNYRMAHEAMLSRVPVPTSHIHRIISEGPDAGRAAQAYSLALREHFGLKEGQWAPFDLVLLGMGPDGHTASLFPGTAAVEETCRLVAAPWVDKFQSHRITLTFPALNNAGCVIFMVAGEDKAEMIRTVLREAVETPSYPAQRIRPANGELLWLIDRAAARLL